MKFFEAIALNEKDIKAGNTEPCTLVISGPAFDDAGLSYPKYKLRDMCIYSLLAKEQVTGKQEPQWFRERTYTEKIYQEV